MPDAQLPERASLEYLKKLAKERLRAMRRRDARAKLADAQLAVAREHGFSSWRTLKAAVAQRPAGDLKRFFEACAKGDVAALRELLAGDPALTRAADPDEAHGGWTGLHTAARRGHLEAVRVLLQAGADPNAREAGDHTYAVHWAAANRHIEIVRTILDAGGDAEGAGDDHALDAIGWATFFHPPDGQPGDRPEVAALLVDRGARHHVFSALALGDANLIRSVVKSDPAALERRLSRFDGGLTPLQFALSRKRYDLLDLLIELGADPEAKDLQGHTALDTAMLLQGDREGTRRLLAAGARRHVGKRPNARRAMAKLANSVDKCVPMIYVPDVAAALDWYASIGFTERARYPESGHVNFGMVALGKAEIMLNMHGKPGAHDASLWLYTDAIDELYEALRSQRGLQFVELINDTFYGARQFGIRDLNGYVLYFIQA